MLNADVGTDNDENDISILPILTVMSKEPLRLYKLITIINYYCCVRMNIVDCF